MIKKIIIIFFAIIGILAFGMIMIRIFLMIDYCFDHTVSNYVDIEEQICNWIYVVSHNE